MAGDTGGARLSELLRIAVRGFTEPASRTPTKTRRARGKSEWKPAEHVLVFDTETTIDTGQGLNFGAYRYHRARMDGSLELVEEALFYGDDLPERDPAGYDALVRHAEHVELELISRTEFVEDVLWRAMFNLRALVVGFNLPFDLSRLAVDWGEARGAYLGGHSLVLWQWDRPDGTLVESRYRPRIHVKAIDSKRAFIRCASSVEVDLVDTIREDGEEPDPSYRYSGRFLDLRAHAFALTNESFNLARACEVFGVGQRKADVEQHGAITPEYVEYCRQDVAATAALYERLVVEHRLHPIGLPPERAYSPASIGKGYLRAMNVRGRLELEPDYPQEVLGAAMVGYYGGRSECRIRRTPVPIVHTDFLSMYSTVNALMGSWDIVTAETVAAVEATDAIQALVNRVQLADCFDPELWKELVALVLVHPDGDVLPTRADYADDGQGWQIGLNPLTAREPLWYPLADIIAAKFLTGKPATIVRAIKLVPEGRQPGLRPVDLRGELTVSPVTDDFFKSVIEQRIKAKQRTDLPDEERASLVGFLKVLGSATGYGIFAEINAKRTTSRRPEPVYVSALGEPFSQLVPSIEDPGEYSFPPLASCVTAGARLMLAILERLVADAGGTYVFCDTDSMAIVSTRAGGLVPCPGGHERLPDGTPAIRALSWSAVETIRQEFAKLSPYSDGESILRLEDLNLDEANGRRRQLYAYAISAKRYVLYNRGRDGSALIRKASEHGLGHLRNPLEPEDSSRDWIVDVWGVILADALGQTAAELQWIDRPAVGRITASSAIGLRPFAGHNARTDLAAKVKPFNFLMTVQVAPFGHPEGYSPQRFQLVAPYDPDPRAWITAAWVDHYSGDSFGISTGWPPSPDSVQVQTYRDVVSRYATQPEPKSLGADGMTCTRKTVGLLQRRSVEANTISIIGKESNRIEEAQAGLVHDLADLLTHYTDPERDPWQTHLLPALRTISRNGVNPFPLTPDL